MRVFENDGRVNFVDDNNVLVGFDNSSNCCERFGTFFSLEIPKTMEDGNTEPAFKHEDFSFDPNFFHEVEKNESAWDEGGAVTFKLVHKTNPADVIYLTLFNSHNGYYSHGFNMKQGETVIQSGSL